MDNDHCKHCGKKLAEERGKYREYCSNACRQAAYRQRKKQADRSTNPIKH